jgi:hypothetical protein
MTPALRKAAVLSLVLVALTIIGAVLFLNEPDRDYGTEPGGAVETGQLEEPVEKPIRKEAVISTSPDTETANKPADAKEPAPKTEKSTADSEPAGLLVLQFLEADGEEPLGNEQFTLLLGGFAKTLNLTLRTDSEGFARVTEVQEGEYPALLRHPHYIADRRVLTISPAEPETDPKVVEVLLEKGKLLSGKVTDLRGKGIKGVSLSLICGTRDGPQKEQATSEADGTFTLHALAIGSWSLTAFHPGYRLGGPLIIEIPTQENLTLQLVESARVNIFVENPDGTPCEGATVLIRTNSNSGAVTLAIPLPIPTVRTNAEGLAIIDNLPASPGVVMSLTAKDDRYPPLVKNVTIDELEGGEFVLRFAARRSLGGIVLDPDGNIVPNIRVSLTGTQHQFVNSISDGTFQFNGRRLVPGKYWLQASAAAIGVSKRLRVDLAQEAPVLVELVLEPGTGSISGLVGDAAGQPLGLFPLKLYSGADISIEAVSSPSGEFSFDYLPKATYTLRAGDAKRGQAVLYKLLPDTEDIRLIIDRPGSLKGIIESEGPALGFSLRLQERPGPDARGVPARTWKFTSQAASFHLRDLPPGSYDLHVLQQGKVIGKLERITIRPGEETGPVGITGLK